MFVKVNQKAFSLVELMVVIAIIAIVASISLASITAIQKSSRDAQRQADLRVIQGAIQQYYADKNKYPNEFPELSNGNAFTNCTGTATPCTVSKTYLSKTPKGPNGEAYFFRPYTDAPVNNCSMIAGVEDKTCHKYYLCGTLEGIPSPSGTVCYVTGTYNFLLTQP